MFRGIGRYLCQLEKIRELAAEYAIWAERELAGKSGAEKRAAVVRKIASLIPAPWYLAPLKEWLIGRAVDAVVERLNWATGWDFAGLSGDAGTVAAALTAGAARAAGAFGQAGAPDHRAAEGVDEKLNALYKQYGILKEADAGGKEAPVPPGAPAAEQGKADTRWEDSIKFVLKWEGGPNFDIVDGRPVLKPGAAADRGGLTNMGITESTLAAAHRQGIVGHSDIVKLTGDEAKRVYRANYWDKYGWGELAWPVCLCCLDITVNHGPGGMARIVQRACGALGQPLAADGKYGPRTKAALTGLAASRPAEIAEQICRFRKDYYDRIIAANPAQKGFRGGWYNRVRGMAEAAGVKSPV